MNWRLGARIAGIGLTAVAILFLARRIFQLQIWDHDIDFARIAPFLAALVPAYAVAVVLLAIAWTFLVGNGVPLSKSVQWYLMAQFGKYLPGNIAHLAGRHYFFAKAGVPQKSLLAAAVVEAALLVAAGGSIAALFLPHEAIPLLDRYLPLSGGEWLAVAIAVCLAILVGCFTLLARYVKTETREKLILPVLLYIAFFFISASTLAGSLAALSPGAVEPHDWMPIVAACSAAWIAGFVIPGAPGGLGIRETMLVLLLSPRFGGETALIAALLYRGVTLAGDALAAVVGLLMANGRMMRRFRSADRDGRSRTST
jgi:uncharacterized membrane protein YbhN (UPF0104 family)